MINSQKTERQNMMKQLYMFLVLFCLGIGQTQAQSAMSVLEKAAANFRKAGGVKIGYTYQVGDENGAGQIQLKGRKFVNHMDGQTIWFDGKTMWTYVPDNEEVNVTTPTQKELAKMNPYAFLSLYKKGYKATLRGKDSKQYYAVELTATDAKRSPKSILVHVNRTDYRLQYARLSLSSGETLTVKVSSYAAKQTWTDSHFTFPKKSYPKAEIIDLR